MSAITNLDSSNIGVDGHLASKVAIIGFDVQLAFFISKVTSVSNIINFWKTIKILE